MNIQTALDQLIAGNSLSESDMVSVMRQVMGGDATPAQIGGLLVALRIKGETVDEVAGAAKVMRELASGVQVSKERLVDTCGTGGDGLGIFNVSTAAAMVVAAAGGRVAKHGNRSVTSTTGSADVLEAAGVDLSLTPQQVAECVDQVGVGFMFAVNHHSAMKHAIGPRRELGIRTIFNLLGPLTNPAGAPNQVIGLFATQWQRPFAEVLKRLGARHVMVVHAEDGLDEISIASPTYVCELKDGEISEYSITPEQFGLKGDLAGLVVNSAEESLALIKSAFCDEHADAKAMIAVNAGAALYVSEMAATLSQGVELALSTIESGAALNKLNELVAFTQQVKSVESV